MMATEVSHDSCGPLELDAVVAVVADAAAVGSAVGVQAGVVADAPVVAVVVVVGAVDSGRFVVGSILDLVHVCCLGSVVLMRLLVEGVMPVSELCLVH